MIVYKIKMFDTEQCPTTTIEFHERVSIKYVIVNNQCENKTIKSMNYSTCI